MHVGRGGGSGVYASSLRLLAGPCAVLWASLASAVRCGLVLGFLVLIFWQETADPHLLLCSHLTWTSWPLRLLTGLTSGLIWVPCSAPA